MQRRCTRSRSAGSDTRWTDRSSRNPRRIRPPGVPARTRRKHPLWPKGGQGAAAPGEGAIGVTRPFWSTLQPARWCAADGAEHRQMLKGVGPEPEPGVRCGFATAGFSAPDAAPGTSCCRRPSRWWPRSFATGLVRHYSRWAPCRLPPGAPGAVGFVGPAPMISIPDRRSSSKNGAAAGPSSSATGAIRHRPPRRLGHTSRRSARHVLRGPRGGMSPGGVSSRCRSWVAPTAGSRRRGAYQVTR